MRAETPLTPASPRQRGEGEWWASPRRGFPLPVYGERDRVRGKQESAHRVVHELLRRRAAPGAGELMPADQVARHAGVEHVGIGPVLVHPAPRRSEEHTS